MNVTLSLLLGAILSGSHHHGMAHPQVADGEDGLQM
jgi:hypothetical protein